LLVRRWPLTVLLVTAVPPTSPLVAQSPPPVAASAAPRKQVRAVRLEGTGIKLDGRLDDPAWGRAAWITDFTQKMPHDGAPPTDSLGLALLYDGDAI